MVTVYSFFFSFPATLYTDPKLQLMLQALGESVSTQTAPRTDTLDTETCHVPSGEVVDFGPG